ncbi:PASTA domain-containing protein [Microbacterium sp. 179-I 3D4 NHS]|uniref:PASTA domain-containing protein n=1 Tax=Microbacterium sp. 179-I 3D4 NHS TaxID=3142381 RepID=UPI00399FCAD5
MVIPQFVGMTLPDAQKAGEDLGLRIYEDDASEEDRSVWIASNWVVVAQEKPPGTFAQEGDQVFLRILKHDEVTTEIADGRRNELLHTNERLFTGVVTGYREEDQQGPSTVYIDDRQVELDLVTPVAPLCADPSSTEIVEALGALKTTLRIGQRVLVVMSDPDTDDGFVHVLPDGANEPGVARPADSANEQLLRTGWWVPEGLSGGPGLYGDYNAPASYEPYSYEASGNSVRDDYAPLLAAAAEETAANYVTGAGDCRRAAEAEAEEWRRRAVDSAESVERFRREQEQRRTQGTYCRDGDGDGICHEG